MKFTIIANGKYSMEWPIIEVIVNGNSCGTAEIQKESEVDFYIVLDQEQNFIEIKYINKKENHTVFSDGQIVEDQSIEIKKVRFDDILLDNWMLTEGCYYPEYFDGFLEQCPAASRELKSQLIWHFPGTFKFVPIPEKKKFWFWYQAQRRHVHIKKYEDKDGYREENYIGSLDPLTDLVNEIKDIINVQ